MMFPIVMLGLIVVGYIFAALRTGTVRSVAMGSRIETLHSRLSPQEVYARLTAGVSGFHMDDADPQAQIVLLSTKPTFATWGFFYPVMISESPNGGTELRISIRSKLIQWGPLVTRWHRKCSSAVDLQINGELPSARVVG